MLILIYLSLLNLLWTLTSLWGFQMCHYPLLRMLCKVIPRAMKHLCFYSLQWNSNVTLGILLHSRSRLGTWEFQILERLFGRSETNIVFWTCQGHCTCERTVNMVDYTQHTCKQAGRHSNVTWRGTHKVPPTAEELLEIVSYGRRDDHFSGDVVPGRLLI